MLGLVQPDLPSARNPQSSEQPETLVLYWCRELDSLRGEIRGRGVDIVAHEIELMASARGASIRIARFASWMDPQLCWRELEDEPTAMGVDVGQLEHVAEERSSPLGILGIDNRVGLL